MELSPLLREFCASKNFHQIADIILNKLELVVKNTHTFRICEIEFYYFGADHPDKYVHCSKTQLQSQVFYFHQYPNGTYKNGTYKGMDITLGHEEANVYFGVLIRSLLDNATGAFIEGPCRSVNRVLELHGLTEIKQLLPKRELVPCFAPNERLFLRHCAQPEQPIWIGPRIGLSDKYPLFRALDYRCAVFPQRLKKERWTLREGFPACWRDPATTGDAPVNSA